MLLYRGTETEPVIEPETIAEPEPAAEPELEEAEPAAEPEPEEVEPTAEPEPEVIDDIKEESSFESRLENEPTEVPEGNFTLSQPFYLSVINLLI